MTQVVDAVQTAPAALRSQEPSVAAFLPAYRRDGTVRAWTLLDRADYEWAQLHRWYLGRDGYFYRNLSHRTEGGGHLALHREVLGLARGDRDNEGDHINRDRLDNRRCNLRVTTSSGNKQNAGRRSDSKHGRGVKFHANCTARPWQARCYVDGKERSLGYFASAEEAAEVARQARAKYQPFATD